MHVFFRFKHVCLESIVYIEPEDVVTSYEIEKSLSSIYEKFKLSFGRLEMFSGIKQRRFWKEGTLPSDAAAKAGRKAIEKAGIDYEKIQCLINSSVSRDVLEPSTASFVHEKIGLSQGVMIFDISNACLGFLNAMVCIGSLIEAGFIKAGLIVSAEKARPLVESTIQNLLEQEKKGEITREILKISFASLTIGSLATAAVLTHDSISKQQHYILGGVSLTDSKFNNLCVGGEQGKDSSVSDNSYLLMNTKAEELLNAGCALAKKTWENLKDLLNITESSPDKIFCHQVGSIHRRRLFEALNIDTEKDFPTYSFWGNTGSAALPGSFALGIEKEPPSKENLIMLFGIGSGINCMMLGIKW